VQAARRRAEQLDDPRALLELGEQLARAGELDGAQVAYRRADDMGQPQAAAEVGALREADGDLAGAEEAYRRADERGDALGALRLGLLLARRGDWAGAKEAYARASQRGGAEDEFDLAALISERSRRGAADDGFRRQPAFANPILVGAVTVLAVMVAVFLAFNANQGLPFVPTRQLNVDIANGSNLVKGNDVREGGFRVGLVSELKPVELANGRVGARLVLKLDQKFGAVPRDSMVTIRPRSVLGLKYVSIDKGSSKDVVPDGGLIPIGQTSVPVQFDDVFKTFDAQTRDSIQRDLVGYGDAFTGRGAALNDTIQSLPELLRHLEPVARYLSDPGTGLTRFLTSLDTFMRVVAPVADLNARLFTEAATTFEAIARDPKALQATISNSPSTEDVSTDSLKTQQPFLANLQTLAVNLAPATAELRAALPDITPAIEVGTQTLKRTPVLNSNLQAVMGELRTFARAPGTNQAVNALTDTVGMLNPMIRFLGPYVTVCNFWNYWWTYLSEHISEKTSFGFAQRALLMTSNPLQPNNESTIGATAPANGGGTDLLSAVGGNQFLHVGNYGAAIDNQGNADCETGQRGYPLKLNHLDPKGRNLVVDPHVPGNQGPTYHGRTRVPKGETFSRNPQFGPAPYPIPQNP
jgi:virulence factor Mce-like protein